MLRSRMMALSLCWTDDQNVEWSVDTKLFKHVVAPAALQLALHHNLLRKWKCGLLKSCSSWPPACSHSLLLFPHKEELCECQREVLTPQLSSLIHRNKPKFRVHLSLITSKHIEVCFWDDTMKIVILTREWFGFFLVFYPSISTQRARTPFLIQETHLPLIPVRLRWTHSMKSSVCFSFCPPKASLTQRFKIFVTLLAV